LRLEPAIDGFLGHASIKPLLADLGGAEILAAEDVQNQLVGPRENLPALAVVGRLGVSMKYSTVVRSVSRGIRSITLV
jgi:hypothetical protein